MIYPLRKTQTKIISYYNLNNARITRKIKNTTFPITLLVLYDVLFGIGTYMYVTMYAYRLLHFDALNALPTTKDASGFTLIQLRIYLQSVHYISMLS